MLERISTFMSCMMEWYGAPLSSSGDSVGVGDLPLDIVVTNLGRSGAVWRCNVSSCLKA